MTPRTPFVPIRTRCPAISLAPLEHFDDALPANDHFFAKRTENDVGAPSSTLDLDWVRTGIGCGCKKVKDGFIVDFEVAAPKEILSAGGALDITKDLAHGSRNDTGLFVTSRQCICLSRRGLTICKDDRVVTLHSSVDVGFGGGVVDGFVGRASEDGVKFELLSMC